MDLGNTIVGLLLLSAELRHSYSPGGIGLAHLLRDHPA